MSLKRLSALVLLCLALAVPALALAQGARTYAVLPFKVNSEKFQYLGKGAQSPMSNRLNWLGYFEPASADKLARAAGRFPTGPADAQSIMSAIGTDFLVAGNLDFQDNDKQINITVNVYDRTGKAWNKSSHVPLEGLLPALERLSGDIRSEVFKRPGDESKAAERKDERPSAAKVSVPRNANFVAGESGDAQAGNAGGPVMNPQFRYEGGAETPGRWQSQSLRFASSNMVVGDFVGDKKNRVIVASDNTLYAYEYYQNVLKPLGEIMLGARIKLLRVSLLDVNRDGKAEILASGVDDPEGNSDPRTFVLNFNNGKFENMLPVQKMFLAVIRTPPTFQPTLVGQLKGSHSPFDESGVSEMYYQDGQLHPMRRLNLPSIANLFNVVYLPDNNSYKVIVLNEYNSMKVYTSDLDLQFTQEEGYNSSNNYVIVDERLPGMNQGKRDISTDSLYYIPIRMLPVSFGSSGKYELLANKDISVAAQIFKKFRRFSQGEVHSLYWDGVGLGLAWKTRRIKGTVVDMALEDLKNDGKKQLIVCINTYSGAIGASNEKTIVVTYDLNADQ